MGIDYLPKTARTLISSERYIETQQKSGMKYVYFGLKEELLKNISRYPKATIKGLRQLLLSCNIDGLPIFRSKNDALWPVLCAVMNITPLKVFPVVLMYGRSKPSDLNFLYDFISDMDDLLLHGIQYGNRTINIKLQCVICDAPAKAMVKSIKLFSGYYGCDKCEQKGTWMGKMTYPEVTNLTIRTDTRFRNQSNSQHHHGKSPFCDLNIDLIAAFPIDYMHQVCLGVMKRLLVTWIRKNTFKLCSRQISEISARLVSIKDFVPNIFARKPRGLEEIDRWKATEYRQFLLYTGKLVLKGILPQEMYDHFLTLSVGISFLVSPTCMSLKYGKYAHDLLLNFVSRCGDLYGKDFLVYNVHSLIHLTADAEEHGTLDSCSAFPFENYLHQLKKMVRSSKNPIVQITKRIKEAENTMIYKTSPDNKISHKFPNNVYSLPGYNCCEVLRTVHSRRSEENYFIVRVYPFQSPIFTSPCDSRIFGAFNVNPRKDFLKKVYRINTSTRGMLIKKTESTYIFLSILHDL
nr:uncharacterized protein LOC123751251 [Procambarus clarkii]XP_045614279.1 uncharacterized protein LOC123768065 [Procambarus clarkii]